MALHAHRHSPKQFAVQPFQLRLTFTFVLKRAERGCYMDAKLGRRNAARDMLLKLDNEHYDFLKPKPGAAGKRAYHDLHATWREKKKRPTTLNQALKVVPTTNDT